MNNQDLIVSQIRQRLEILYQMVDELEGGGSSGDAYTKAQTDALLDLKADKSSTYTKSEVNTALSGKQNTTLTGYTTDTAEANITSSSTVTEGIEQLDYRSVRDKTALIEIVDGGAKNLLESAEQQISETRLISFNISIPPGKYVIYVGEYSSTDTDDTRAQAYFFDSNGNTCSSRFIQTKANGMYQEVTVSEQTDHLSIYASDNYSHSANDTVTVAKVMVCTKADWDISHTYQPYRPTYQELYDTLALYDTWTTYNDQLIPASSLTNIIDSDNSSCIIKINTKLRRVVCILSLKFLAAYSSTSSAIVAQIPQATYAPAADVRAYVCNVNYSFRMAKGAGTKGILINTYSGEVPSGTTITAQFEWTY